MACTGSTALQVSCVGAYGRSGSRYTTTTTVATPTTAGEHRGVIELAECSQPIVRALQPERHLVRLRLRLRLRLSVRVKDRLRLIGLGLWLGFVMCK